MTETKIQRIGEQGQITIPKELRQALGIESGDEIEIRGEPERIVIEKTSFTDILARGYRRRADRTQELANKMQQISREANAHLGDTPEWDKGG